MKKQLLALSSSILVMTLFTGTTALLTTGCGDNLFSSLHKKDDKDKGRSAFQQGDYAGAITYLNDYIAGHPDDTEARSMLATAYMKKVGLDELQIAANITSSTASATNNGWTSIVSLMPAGSEANISALTAARDTIAAIPEASRTPEQNYQLAVASSALAITVVKKSLCDDTGAYTPTDEKIQALSADDANLIVQSISTTATAVAATGSSNSGLSKLADVSTQIDSQTGSDNLSKLQSFLTSKR